MTRRIPAVCVAFVLLVSGGALAQTPADIAGLRVKANAGDAAAQLDFGITYVLGQGVPQDYAQAVAWYRKAADQEIGRAHV